MSQATRTRPADRRAQLLDAAAVAFGARGYAAVSLGDIAAAVGISAPALYRHVPNKYALFAEVAQAEMTALLEAARAVPDPDDLDAVMLAIAGRTVEHRDHGSLYRWEARFLTEADRARLRGTTRALRACVARPLTRRRTATSRVVPEDADPTLLASAALAVVASVTAHRLVLPDLAERVARLAAAVATVPLPPDPGPAPAPTREPTWRATLVPSSTRERLLVEALKAFERHGYLGATMEEIAGAVGLSAPAAYRYVPTKAALLAEAFSRSQVRLDAVVRAALADVDTADEALPALAAAYVQLWFQQPEVMSVWGAESGHLGDDEREELRAVQRDHVAVWVALLREVRPDLDPVDARLRVHAALTVVVDTGRLLRFDRRPGVRARVVALVLGVLLAP